MLEANELEVGYGSSSARFHRVAGPLSVALPKGQLVCLLGPNGAGKSSLMRTLAGLQPALAGRVILDGADIHQLSARERALRLSVVLTDSGSSSLLDVQTVVGLGRYPHTGWSGRLSAEDLSQVRWAIEVVGIEDLAQRPFSELSDGERQKTMIARALAQQSRILILDEITAYLDLPRRVQTMQLLRRIARDGERAVLLSSHDLDLALRSADCMWLMGAEESMAVGAPEDLILSGDFERVFEQDGVKFDKMQGSFAIHHDRGPPVHLIGDGIAALWTIRALEREGFDVFDEARAEALGGHDSRVPRVEVMQTASGNGWLLSEVGETRQFCSLLELCQALRCLVTAPTINSHFDGG